MKKRVRIKKLPFVLLALFLIPILCMYLFQERDLSEVETPSVMETITETIPVISENNTIINPYNNPSVSIGKNYYDYQETDNQENSITYYDNTYYQNTGIDFVLENEFEVIAIMDGTVSEVKEEEKVGKEIKIEHENGLVSIYQSLSDILVKKGDIVNKGQLIGKSGTNELDKDLGNHLHFELYENGKNVNPNNYLNKEYKKEN